MRAVSVRTVRLFLHVVAAAIWVGGQITLTGLVPRLRDVSQEAPRAVARRFAQSAWPAYAVLVVTGVWNIVALRARWTGAYSTALIVKIMVVGVSGLAAWAHSASRSAAAVALWGAMTGVSAVAALFLGVLLHGKFTYEKRGPSCTVTEVPPTRTYSPLPTWSPPPRPTRIPSD